VPSTSNGLKKTNNVKPRYWDESEASRKKRDQVTTLYEFSPTAIKAAAVEKLFGKPVMEDTLPPGKEVLDKRVRTDR
jgi:hypothetical protein